MIQKNIAEIALSYEGQRETAQNSGFQSPEFLEKMKAVGFVSGDAWCAHFAKLVWLEAYRTAPELAAQAEKLFSPSATKTWENFDKSDWKTQTPSGKPIKTPQVGALAVWRHGTGWQGHIGVVVEVIDNTTFKSIEGNTNDDGSREGYEVAIRTRRTNDPFRTRGLNLIGFVLPKPISVTPPNPITT